jgi:hypothetical protein
MLTAKLAVVARACTRHAWSVIAMAGVVALVSGDYVIRHFAIDTDINKLISPDLAWRQHELLGVGVAFKIYYINGSAIRSDRPAAVEPGPRRRLQRDDHGDRPQCPDLTAEAS